MPLAQIKTPVSDFTGYRATVYFIKGVGETNDPHLIDWFKRNGYTVEEPVVRKKVEEVVVKETVEQINLDAMNLEELKAHAKSIGKGRGVGVLKTREQVIKHIMKE